MIDHMIIHLMQYVRALYSYVPAKDSPNPAPEMELEFVKGDIIMVHGKIVSLLLKLRNIVS